MLFGMRGTEKQNQELSGSLFKVTRDEIYIQSILTDVPESGRKRNLLHKLGIDVRYSRKAKSLSSRGTWYKPEDDEVTISTDGSVADNDNWYGGPIRDHKGTVKPPYAGMLRKHICTCTDTHCNCQWTSISPFDRRQLEP
ncbi:hypothetical protein IFM89_019159 [Coptis chinensis]|uniref:Uncharacterized protein n=1 Tax=Coptis chinensis TaxID=261450 RepID=A0A835GX92_9MAGN|nr:hypothetical protein IFM89_019159 [Coptis chinensis]